MRQSGFFLLLLFWCLSLSCSSEGPVPAPEEEVEPSRTVEPDGAQGTPTAVIETDSGEITLELLPDLAPRTVQHFVELAEVGFYNRTTFHRVLQDRMIQGGDPYSRDRDPYNDGQGTSGTLLPQEFGSTEVDRGTVAMAHKEGSQDGGSCQFFIVLRRTPEWDGQYNVFGKVVDGIEVVEKISRAPLTKSYPNLQNRPAGQQVIKRIRIE